MKDGQTTGSLRHHARAIFDRAVAAANPASALKRSLAAQPLPAPARGGRSILISIGKAAPAMLSEALAHIQGPYVALAVTQDDNHTEISGATLLHAAHPVPDARGLRAGQQVIELLRAARTNDQVIALISGGASALVPTPAPGISLSDKIAVNELLLSSGLDITDINLVRQHLSTLKGGGFLRLAAPAPVTAYILSDVIGDDLRVVASGPTVTQIGTREEARMSCFKARIWAHLPNAVRARLEEGTVPTVPPPPATNHLIGSNKISLADAHDVASQEINAHIVSDKLTGDVKSAADLILRAAHACDKTSPVALLFGGETTVQLRGTGRGGAQSGVGASCGTTIVASLSHEGMGLSQWRNGWARRSDPCCRRDS